ncbi:hypothetical protein EDF61_102206 [Arthrobacter sp. JUb115]|nr:hypothetical protein EDF61_102206 [Arthrobacter sp. JUb115]
MSLAPVSAPKTHGGRPSKFQWLRTPSGTAGCSGWKVRSCSPSRVSSCAPQCGEELAILFGTSVRNAVRGCMLLPACSAAILDWLESNAARQCQLRLAQLPGVVPGRTGAESCSVHSSFQRRPSRLGTSSVPQSRSPRLRMQQFRLPFWRSAWPSRYPERSSKGCSPARKNARQAP